MDEISGDLESAKQEPLVVPIDQHFNVKGIGLVAIGYVQSGSVSVHDELHLLPAEGPGTVKRVFRSWMMMSSKRWPETESGLHSEIQKKNI